MAERDNIEERARAEVRKLFDGFDHLLRPDAGLESLRLNLKFMVGWGPLPDGSAPYDASAAHVLAKVIDLAKGGDRVAAGVLEELAGRLLNSRQALPEALQGYLLEQARSPTPLKRGRHPDKLACRDFLICWGIGLAVKCGLTARRHALSQGDVGSGCSVVAEVLGDLQSTISEDAVESIWNRRALYLEVLPKEIVLDLLKKQYVTLDPQNKNHRRIAYELLGDWRLFSGR